MTAAPPQPPEHLPLAALFPQADRGQWQELVAATLRKSGRIAPGAGADTVEAALTSRTYDGIEVLPLYTAQDAPMLDAGLPGVPPFVRGAAAEAVPATGAATRAAAEGAAGPGWDVRQRHHDPDPEVTREAVMTDLENGVTSLWL